MSREAAFIDSLRALATHPAARNLTDDCAVLELGRETLVLTHDMLVEGTHYLSGADMADVAWRLVATNLSDLAAKGAEPLGVLLGHMLGDGDDRFVAGLAEVLAHYQVPLLGGDTTAGQGTRSHGLTAVGRATHTPVPSRSGAQPGDGLWLTGQVGAAMLGFEALRVGTGADHAAYTRPHARLAEGRILAPLVTAMMDVSDGLLLDAFDADGIAECFGIARNLTQCFGYGRYVLRRQQGGPVGSVAFTSQFGTFTADSLPIVSPPPQGLSRGKRAWMSAAMTGAA